LQRLGYCQLDRPGVRPSDLPTGDEIFTTGAASNTADYSSAVNDANILATETAPNQAAEFKALFKYQDYLAKQVPVCGCPIRPSS
jgi:hypothetical protein